MLKNAFKNIDVQNRALDVSWLKHEVISQNIANAETPGYKRKKVVFENILEQAINDNLSSMKLTHAKHLSTMLPGSPAVMEDRGYGFRIDGNNVNIDVEMAEQATNQIRYNAMINQVSSQLRRLKAAIRGGA